MKITLKYGTFDYQIDNATILILYGWCIKSKLGQTSKEMIFKSKFIFWRNAKILKN